MHVNPLPTIFTENFEEYFRPLFEGLLFCDYELKIKGETEIKLIGNTTCLLLYNDGRDTMSYGLKTIKLLKFFLTKLERCILFRKFSFPSLW